MTKRQKVYIMVAIAAVLIGLATYGTISLMAKINEVKVLNGQVAEEGDPDVSADPGNGEKPGGGGQDGATDGGHGDGGHTDGETGPDGEPLTVGSEGPAGTASPSPSKAAEPTDKPSQPGQGEPTSAVTQPPATAQPTPAAGQSKAEIDAGVTSSMESLRNTCTATSSKLVAAIKAEISANKDAGLEALQSEYLGQVVSAEASCDTQFNGLVSGAREQYKQAGLSESELPDWSTEYNRAKENARSAALLEIASALD